MRQTYLLAIDQSTQGTKGMLFDCEGRLISRCDRSHAQLIDNKGWVEHDPEEIYRNTVAVVRDVVEKAGIDKNQVAAVGISNQRETAVVWDRESGKPVYNAIVWQCARGEQICEEIRAAGYAERVRESTGLPLSPYFSAAKIAWVFRNVDGVEERARAGGICCGTVDSWLLYRLTGGKTYATDYSNASRTQLFNIRALSWDPELCMLFGIPMDCMAQVRGSDEWYGDTDFEGFFDHSIPILAVLGDSHGALFGQDCREPGLVKATYGTGSSVMLNTGDDLIVSQNGLVTSLAWCMHGKVQYVLEGNINYTGSVIGWLKNDLGLVQTVQQAHELAAAANPLDKTYFVPAFTGLGAPYWDSAATGLFTGITRLTGRAELVKAGVDCIAYQVADIVSLMREESGLAIRELRVDGGPTESSYLMQRQSDILGIPVCVPQWQELSGMGAAYAAGISAGIYDQGIIFSCMERTAYERKMPPGQSEELYRGWKHAVQTALNHG
ncbi:FGGY-family carbohydrate kinase [Faecalispora anaeroviscerum]|uniref:FGGY-family carbohydrate kinase n=1 Tax=Faecalispora anaeroviscerum TaxID=2991836 RepID=UPI0024B884F8|nr:glycerol kinase [Faecalispora anaeroviscerum]